MSRGYQYSSPQIKNEFKKMRDRLYRRARRGGYSDAYDELKNELKNIDYIDEDVLDYLESAFDQIVDVNKVNPMKYNDAMFDKVNTYINDMIEQNRSYPLLIDNLLLCQSRFLTFVNQIGKYAFTSFMNESPEFMDYIEKIYEIYMQYLQGDITYEEFESQVNAILYMLEGLYNAYPHSEEYEQYKQWEKDMSNEFNIDFDSL